MERSELKELILEISEGILSTAVDFTLHSIFCSLQFGGSRTARTAWRMSRKANEQLKEINYETFKNAFYELRRKGFIKYMKEKETEQARITITELGEKRLKDTLPTYLETRPWDGKIYLITYDIPERHKTLRNDLRDKVLKKLSSGMLQRSVWMTPYYPRELVEAWALEHGMTGLVLISELETEGSFGETTTEYLLEQVYKLTEVNKKYKNFINKYEGKEKTKSIAILDFDFLSCVQGDPQLPFELLPEDWASNKAHKLYRKLRNTNLSTT